MLKKPTKQDLFKVFFFLLPLPSLLIAFHTFGIVFTYTGSVPIGFYRIKPITELLKQGEYISFCLPDDIANIGMKQYYLKPGDCKNGSEQLIKQIIAVPGDNVWLMDNKIIVTDFNSKLKKASYFAPIQLEDKSHLPVKRFISNGNYTATGYWVYGFASPLYSWDSRYYGEIPRKNIKHRLVPLWVF